MEKLNNMNPKAKALWLAEIKAQFKTDEQPSQRQETKLKYGNVFSIDGLLENAYLKAKKKEWGVAYVDSTVKGRNFAMSNECLKWAGLTRVDPYVYAPWAPNTVITLAWATNGRNTFDESDLRLIENNF